MKEERRRLQGKPGQGHRAAASPVNNVDVILHDGVSVGVEGVGLGDGVSTGEAEVAGASDDGHLPRRRHDVVPPEES